MSQRQAVILAGGKGSRLRPYTTVLPKPLLPIGEYPIAEIIIRQLKYFGFTDIVITTGHLAELIESFFGDGKRFGVKIRYFREEAPLGTAGGLREIPGLQENFLIINGDTLTDCDYRTLHGFHAKKKAAATIGVKEVTSRNDFGVISFDGQSRLLDYVEKPETKSFLSLGINVLNRRCVTFIKKGEVIGMPDLMLRMKAAGEPVFCFPIKDQWYDLGRMADLSAAQEIFERHKRRFLPE